MTTTKQIEDIFRRLMGEANTGAQRTPLVPVLSGQDPPTITPGLMWARDDQQQVYLRLKNTTVALVNTLTAAPSGGSGSGSGSSAGSAPGTVSSSVIADRSVGGIKLMLDTVGADEIKDRSVGNNELTTGAVDGRTLGTSLNASSRLELTAPATGVTPITARGLDGQTAPILSAWLSTVSRFSVGPDTASVGLPLPNSGLSVQDYNPVGKVLLRLRGGGGSLLRAEDPNGNMLFEVDGQGNIGTPGKLTALGGAETSGALAVNGPMTVNNQANFLAGVAVTGAAVLRGSLSVDGRPTFNQGAFLAAPYAAKVGSAVWLRSTTAADPNRLVVEGVTDTSVAEVQLGTGGPVLSGALGSPNVVRVNGFPVVIAAGTGGSAGLVTGAQLGFDTITGGPGSGYGNLAAQTIWDYNLRDFSVTRTKLSLAAVGAAQIASGSVDSTHIASMFVDRLISGTLNADEIFMGPSGKLYAGPLVHADVTGQRVQLDVTGLRAFDTNNVELASLSPGGFALRSAVSGTRMELNPTDGFSAWQTQPSGAVVRTVRLGTDGRFILRSTSTGGSSRFDADNGLEFVAAATRNVAFNPGFEGGSSYQFPVNMFATDDQQHVFLGEFAVKTICNNANVASDSYVDVPFGQVVGTSQSIILHARDNFCPNPALAVDASGWSAQVASGSTGAASDAVGFQRPRAFSATAFGDGQVTVIGPAIPVVQNQQWTVSAQVKISRSQPVYVEVRYYDAAGVLLLARQSDTLIPGSSDVNRIGRMSYVPAGAVSMRMAVVVPNALNLDYVGVSAALYERAATIGVYADGDSSGWNWQGTAGGSASFIYAAPYTDSIDNLVSIFVWSDAPVYVQAAAWDSTANAARGAMAAPQLLLARRWNRVWFLASGVCDKVRLYAATLDAAAQSRYLSPVWWSGLQVEQSKPAAPITRPSPLAVGSEPGCVWEGVPRASSSLRAADTTVATMSPSFGATVAGALTGGSLTGTSIFGARIVGTEIYGGRVVGNEIDGARVVGTTITGSLITGTNIRGTNIQGTDIIGGTITGTNVNGVAISGGTITGTVISAITINGATINSGILRSADISGSRVIAGTLGAGRVELEGRLGAIRGVFAYNSSNRQVFSLNSDTGTVSIEGTFTTGYSGERVLISDKAIYFYPSSGDNYSSILVSSSVVNSTTVSSVKMQNALPSATGLRSVFNADFSRCLISQVDSSGNNVNYISLSNNNFSFINNNTFLLFASPSEALLRTDTSRLLDITVASTLLQHNSLVRLVANSQELRLTANSSSLPVLSAQNQLTAIQFATTGIDIYNPSSGAYKAVGASAFVTNSSQKTKKNVEPLPFSPVNVIENAEVYMWEYVKDETNRKRFGPLAEDLNQLLHVNMPGDTLGVDLLSQVSVVWAAIPQIMRFIRDLTHRVDELTAAGKN